MNSFQGKMSGILAASFGLVLFCNSALAQFVSREQIVEALTAQPSSLNFRDKLANNRSLTLKNGDYGLASVQPKATIDLHEIFFEFNSAAITEEARPQLDELGAALTNPRLKGSIIAIGGHTDAVGGGTFNQNLSERRAAAIKWYLVDNFNVLPASLHSVGYGKRFPRNKADIFAPENRRVEIVNESLRAQHY